VQAGEESWYSGPTTSSWFSETAVSRWYLIGDVHAHVDAVRRQASHETYVGLRVEWQPKNRGPQLNLAFSHLPGGLRSLLALDHRDGLACCALDPPPEEVHQAWHGSLGCHGARPVG